MRTTFSELELFRLGYSRILKVYTMFNDSRALQLGIDMINGLASRVGLDEGSNELALLSVQRGELLHNLYISNHQLETLLDAIQTITQGIKMFPDNDERRLDAILLLRHFLRSYEERGGDVFSLDTSILTIAFGPEAERYSSINFAKRLYERIGANHGSYEIYEKWTGVLTRQEWETYQTLDSDQLESAIDQLADRLRSLQPNSQDYATTLFKLARAADVKYQRTWRYEDLISTLSLYEESLKLATPEQYIQQFLLIALSYGQLLYSRGQLSRAQDLFDQARNASLKLHGFVSQELQENASSQRDDRYPHIIAQLISDGKLVDAYEYILIAKQPFIKDVPLGVLLDLSGLGLEQSQIAKDIEDIRFVQKNLGEVLEQINSASLTANILATLRNQLVELHSREKQIINDLTKRSYSGLRRLERHAETKYEEIQKMVTSLGIKAIEYYEHADGWGAFILDGTNIRYVPLPNLGADILSNMHQWLKDLEYVSKRSIQSTETLLTEWHSAMFAPLETYCIVGEKLPIAGYNELHYLPMHIAFSPVRRHYLLEDFSISFVDSMSHLNFISQHIQNNDSYSIPKKALLSVAVPGSPSSPLFLGSAKPESDSLAAIFPSSYQLQDNEATIDQVLFYAKTSSLIHFACHGYSSIEQPTNSGLVLADGILNVDAIQNSVHWFSKKLVILASCRSGQANIINPMPLDWLASNRWRKDLLGISRAFLSSGVDCVLSAMWDASDTITKQLIERFCLQIRQGISPSEALQFAVKDIRSDPRYSLLEHPFYWAGFQVQGLGMLTIKSLDMLKEPGKHEEERGYDQQQGLELFEHMGDQIRRADDLYNQGASASSRGKYEEARSYYQRSLELFGLLGNRSVRADIWYNLGTTAYRQKKYEEARGYYQQSLALFEPLKDEHGRASALQA